LILLNKLHSYDNYVVYLAVSNDQQCQKPWKSQVTSNVVTHNDYFLTYVAHVVLPLALSSLEKRLELNNQAPLAAQLLHTCNQAYS